MFTTYTDIDHDSVFATLAAEVGHDTVAMDALREAVRPACTAICAARNDEALLAAVIEAACAEVMDWARTEQYVTTKAA